MDINEKINDIFFQKEKKRTEYYKEPKEKKYAKFFENTAQLINKTENKELIIDIKENQKLIGYKFLKCDNSPGYEEYFIWKELVFFSELSEKISFIFPSNSGKNLDKLLGYRFYEEEPIKTIKKGPNYFTLVLKDDKKYEILELNSGIKDNKGNSFIINNINCFSIILKIIKERFKDNITYDYPSTSIELLGLYYSLMNDNKCLNKNIKLIDPYFPIINNKNTMKEAINEHDISNDKLFVEPIFFNSHVSVLYFKFNNKKRSNQLIDSSFFHYNSILKDNAIFPETIRNRIQIFPKSACQSGPSCSLWFVAQILALKKHGNDLFTNEDEFNYINLIRMIDYINEMIKIDETSLIYGAKDNIISKSINISYDKNCFIAHKIVFASFLNILGTINNFATIGTYLDYDIDEIKNKFEKIRLFICNCKYSKQYYDFLGTISDITDDKIKYLKTTFLNLKQNYENFIQEYIDTKDDVSKIYELKKNFILLLDKTFENMKLRFSWNVYEKEQIKNFLREKNNIFYLLTELLNF